MCQLHVHFEVLQGFASCYRAKGQRVCYHDMRSEYFSRRMCQLHVHPVVLQGSVGCCCARDQWVVTVSYSNNIQHIRYTKKCDCKNRICSDRPKFRPTGCHSLRSMISTHLNAAGPGTEALGPSRRRKSQAFSSWSQI